MRWPWVVALALASAACAPPAPAYEALLRPRPDGELVLRCSQPDAEVWLDGVPQGTCEDFDGEPRGLGLRGRGSRHVEVRKDGFFSWESALEADGTRVQLDVALQPTGAGP